MITAPEEIRAFGKKELLDLIIAMPEGIEKNLALHHFDAAYPSYLSSGDYGRPDDAAECEQSLASFMRGAWPLIEYSPLSYGMPTQAISEHLEAVTRGEISRLIINVPPGHGKTVHTTTIWPAWMWTKMPHVQFLFAGHSFAILRKSALRRMSIFDSTWYQARWGLAWKRNESQWNRDFHGNTKNGSMEVTSIGGRSSGKHCNILVIDDANDRHDFWFPDKFINANRYYDEVLTQCVNPAVNRGDISAIVVDMQRLHHLDLTAHLMNQGGWVCLKLPTRFIRNKRCATPIWRDPRKKSGELLWPERFNEKQIREEEKNLVPRAFAALHQQEPSAEQGNLIQRDWWKFYEGYDIEAGKVFLRVGETRREADKIICAWDTTRIGGSTAAYVSADVWAMAQADYFLLDNIHRRMGFMQTRDSMVGQWLKWAQIRDRLIEKAANAEALKESLEKEWSGIILVPVKNEAKVARTSGIAHLFRAGNVHAPDPVHNRWVETYIEEWTNFPTGKYKDRVDAGTMALAHLSSRPVAFGVSTCDEPGMGPATRERLFPRMGMIFEHGRRGR